jgi:electron transport complex protein RnfG
MEKENNITAAVPEPSPLRLISTLGLAGLVSGACLVGSYLYTLPLIQAAKARAMEAAVYEVLPGCESFETLELRAGMLVPQKEGSGGDRVFAGYDATGRLIGYAIQSRISGFQDIIEGLFGYRPESKTIIGLKILESRETPGLGDKIFKDPEFAANFQELQVEPTILLVKKGAKQRPNEVDAITGATISSKAVVGLLNSGIGKWKPVLGDAPAQINSKQ